MLIATLGIEALSQLTQSATGQASTSTGSQFKLQSDPAANPDQSLTTPQPPSDTTPIGQAATKILANLNSLLLSIQAKAGTSPTTTASAASNSYTATDPNSSTTTDPNAKLQSDLQTLFGDLKNAAHHHHAHPSGTAATTQPDADQTGQLGQMTQAINAYTANQTNAATTASTLQTA